MKNISSKSRWLCVFFSLLLLFGSLTAMASSSLDSLTAKYSGLEEDEIFEQLSRCTFSEICDEINILSKNGVVLSELLSHSVVLAEKANNISDDEMFKLIEDEENSENLRVICVQLLGVLNGKFAFNDTSRLEAILLNEKENSLVRQNIVWTLSSDEKSNNILETVIFQEDEQLAFQALKKLNMDNPERARAIANTLIKTESQNEKLRIAIKVISSQMAQSNNTKEKDQWVAYCMKLFDKSSNMKNSLINETIIFALSDMYYIKALYGIINNEQIDDSYKVFCIGQNYQVIIDVLENAPTENDIEMAIKSMTICPIDKTVDALKVAVNKSEREYNLDSVLVQQAEPANEKWNNK